MASGLSGGAFALAVTRRALEHARVTGPGNVDLYEPSFTGGTHLSAPGAAGVHVFGKTPFYDRRARAMGLRIAQLSHARQYIEHSFAGPLGCALNCKR